MDMVKEIQDELDTLRAEKAGLIALAENEAREVMKSHAEIERLRAALGEIENGYGPQHLSKYFRAIAKEALK